MEVPPYGHRVINASIVWNNTVDKANGHIQPV